MITACPTAIHGETRRPSANVTTTPKYICGARHGPQVVPHEMCCFSVNRDFREPASVSSATER
jgi:hypothetical protein